MLIPTVVHTTHSATDSAFSAAQGTPAHIATRRHILITYNSGGGGHAADTDGHERARTGTNDTTGTSDTRDPQANRTNFSHL